MSYSTLERFKTVAKAAVTWLVVLAGVLTIAAEELAEQVGADSPVVVLILRVVAWVGTAVAIIRRSTPVLPEARGIIGNGEPATSEERWALRELAAMQDINRSIVKGD